MITTLLFDLDDTLIPSAERAQTALDGLEAAGGDMNRYRAAGNELWTQVEAGHMLLEEMWHQAALLAGATLTDADSFVATLTRFEAPFPDALPLLEELAPHFTLGVISNGPPGRHQRAKLEVAGLDRFFGDRVFISAEVGAYKPDARIFHHALRTLGVEPAVTLYVGDKLEHDALGAHRAGLRGLWLDRTGMGGQVPTGVRRITMLDEIRTELPRSFRAS